MLTFRKQLSAAFTTLIVLTNNAICMNAHICEVGKERDHQGQWKWVLPHPDPCQCTKIVMGGMNTITPKRSFTPKYADRPLLSDDTELIRRYYNLNCDTKEGNPESTDRSTVQNGEVDTMESDASPTTNVMTTVNVNGEPSEVRNESNDLLTSSATLLSTNIATTDNSRNVNEDPSKGDKDSMNKPSSVGSKPATSTETPVSTHIALTDGCSNVEQCACSDRNGNKPIDLIGKNASMSSGIISENITGALAANAIDGNINGDFYVGSCTHTKEEFNPWWKVYIGGRKCIGMVEVYNRVDCCGERLNGAIVRVGPNQNHTLNSACGSPIDVTGWHTDYTQNVDVECNLNGRYLSIELPKKERLQLCEVKAFVCTICD